MNRVLLAAVLLLTSAVFVLDPAAALACPACATRDSAGLAAYSLVAGMVAVPYAISIVVLRVIRNLDRRTDGAP